MEHVAITGLGVISSLGHSIEEFGERLSACKPEVREAPWAGEEGLGHAWCSPLSGFHPEEWMDERVVRGTDPFAWYGIAAAVSAVGSSGIGELDPLRTAVVFGTAMAAFERVCDAQHAYEAKGPMAVDRKVQLQFGPNMAAAHIALRYALHGPSLTVSTACASSLDAISLAARMIESGMVDAAIAGGSDNLMNGPLHAGAVLAGMTGEGDDPYRICRPFDVNRSGIFPGQGAGMVILERADLADARGATVHGRIRGYAAICDAYHPSSPDPTGQWERRVMELAQGDAGVAPEAVDALVAHGTGTPVGDTAEIRAINDLFGRRRVPLPVTSIKGHVGHTVGAAGVMGLIGGLHSIRQGALVPTAGTTDLDPEVEFFVPLHEPTAVDIGTLQVNSFGFGGQNSSMVVTRD